MNYKVRIERLSWPEKKNCETKIIETTGTSAFYTISTFETFCILFTSRTVPNPEPTHP